MPDVRKYRLYQSEIHDFVMDRIRNSHVGLEGPTGMGKTVQIVGIVADLARRKSCKGVVVATTQEQIEANFTNICYDKIVHRGKVIPVPPGLIKAARDSGATTRRAVLDTLHGKNGFAVACTHATLARLSVTDLPEDLSGYVFVADEGHHTAADALSRFYTAFLERGGLSLHVTATGYRADGRKVGPPDADWYIRSMSQHMEEGFAPKNLRCGVTAVTSKKVGYSQLTGSTSPPVSSLGPIASEMLDEWERLGRPKCIVRVPPVRGGSQKLVGLIIRKFTASGAKVVDATGSGPSRKRAFQEALREESGRTFKGSQVDVIVGSQRVLEGTDWPHCEAVFCVGIPGSVTLVVQLSGRATRLKDSTCPRSRADTSRLHFFVPTSGKDTFESMSMDHSKAILTVACFLADSQSGQQWLLEKEMAKYRRKSHVSDPSDRTAILSQLSAVRRDAEESGVKLTVSRALEALRNKLPNVNEDLAKEIIAESLLKSSAAGKVRERLRAAPLGVSGSTAKVIDSLVTEFRDATLDGDDSSRVLIAQSHKLTGVTIQEWADRVKSSAPLSVPLIKSWISKWRAETGKVPTARSGTIPGTSETWKGVDSALSEGRRGLPGGTTLYELTLSELGMSKKGNLTEAQIIQWATEWKQKHGKLPSSDRRFGNAGLIPGTNETWSGIYMALHEGLRGLPKGSGLKHLFTKHGLTDLLSEKLILEQAKAFLRSHRRLPTARDESAFHPDRKESWKSLDLALYKGYKGLPGGSSLSRLFREAGLSKSREIDPNWVICRAKVFKKRYGKLPTGSILLPLEPGKSYTWKGIDMTMRGGNRGFPEKYSLRKLFEDHGLTDA